MVVTIINKYMKITDYCDILNKEIKIIYYPNQNGRWSARIEFVEVLEGSLLVGSYGNSDTPYNAIKDYINKIKGKRIVFNAMMADKRQEFDVPKNLEY